MMNVCVFCGSSVGADPEYKKATLQLAREFVSGKIKLLYGAGSVGLMGVMADEMLSLGGSVCGVVTHYLKDKEVVHHNLTELILVDSMSERKSLLIEKSDAFIILPGGFGTMDEMFEVLTLQQLGLISKPVGILNTSNYYSPLLQFLENSVAEKFLRKEHLESLSVDENPAELLNKMNDFSAISMDKWIGGLRETNKF